MNLIRKIKNVEKTIAYLEGTGRLYEAWNELQTYLQVNKDANCILLDNYVISKSEGMMRPYEDNSLGISICNEKKLRCSNQYALCRLVDGGKIQLTPPGFLKKESIEEILDTIAMKNPSVMLGYTNENQRAYKEMTRR